MKVYAVDEKNFKQLPRGKYMLTVYVKTEIEVYIRSLSGPMGSNVVPHDVICDYIHALA